MDKDTFDTAMKLNHGRTVMEGEKVLLKKNDNWNECVNIISISHEGINVEPNSYDVSTEYLLNNTFTFYNIKRLIPFYYFLINFIKFYNNGQ